MVDLYEGIRQLNNELLDDMNRRMERERIHETLAAKAQDLAMQEERRQ